MRETTTEERGTAVVNDGPRTRPVTEGVDWPRYMRGLGRHTRRVREFLGLSQEQVARAAGVSQGAISRLESGRGLATPLLVLLKINAALKRELSKLDPAILSDEVRTLREIDDRIAPLAEGGGFKDIPLMKDAELEDLVRVYRSVPERQRQRLLPLLRAAAEVLRPG